MYVEQTGAVGQDFGPKGPRLDPRLTGASSVVALSKSHFHSFTCTYVLYVLSCNKKLYRAYVNCLYMYATLNKLLVLSQR